MSGFSQTFWCREIASHSAPRRAREKSPNPRRLQTGVPPQSASAGGLRSFPLHGVVRNVMRFLGTRNVFKNVLQNFRKKFLSGASRHARSHSDEAAMSSDASARRLGWGGAFGAARSHSDAQRCASRACPRERPRHTPNRQPQSKDDCQAGETLRLTVIF